MGDGLGSRSARARTAVLAVALIVLAGVALGGLVGLLGGRLVGSIEVSEPPPPPAKAAASKKASPTPTEGGQNSPAPTPGSPAATTPGSPSAGLTLTAQADASAASPGQRITITGFYAGAPAGTRLQVQRRVGSGGWQDFPATTRTDADGGFDVWIRTNVKGPQELRVLDTASGLACDPIPVTIG
jgi:hypothetical protein